MSRAFVKESDDQAMLELPERPQSPYPVMLTQRGLQKLRDQEADIEAQKRAITAEEDLLDKDQLQVLERDQRYVQDRIAKAVVVDLAAQPRDRVDFGAIVDTVDENDQRQHFQIVGEDEADPSVGLVSWVSPLGLALRDARVGDSVIWRRPIGDLELEVVAIKYPSD